MRTTLLLSTLLIPSIIHAQLTAGEVPLGTTTYDPGIALSLATQFTQDSADIELDCDDFADVRVWLHRGAPELDAPNIAELHFVDSDIEVCMNTEPGFGQRPKYHAFGEALDCSGDFVWEVVDPIILGNFGGFLGTGPWSIDSSYIAYRRGSEMGWMLLSFDLDGNPGVDLQVHELLPLCQISTSISEVGQESAVIHPNPTNGAPLQMRATQPNRNIQVLDVTGKILADYAGNTRTIDAPEVPGIYFARVIGFDGDVTISRFVRY